MSKVITGLEVTFNDGMVRRWYVDADSVSVSDGMLHFETAEQRLPEVTVGPKRVSVVLRNARYFGEFD